MVGGEKLLITLITGILGNVVQKKHNLTKKQKV